MFNDKFKRNAPLPKNQYAVEVARKSIESLMPTAQRHLANAITGDGRNCILYMPKTHGLRCSCRTRDPLTTDGKLRPEVMASILDSDGWEIDDYVPQQDKVDGTNYLEDDDGFSDTIHTPDMPSYDFSTLNLNGDIESGFKNKTIVFDRDNQMPDPIDVTDSSFKKAENSGALYSTAASSSCAICFGTGWCGGFDVYGGTRLVLPVSAATSILGGTIVSDNPYYIDATVGCAIIYNTVVLPKGITRVDEICLWSNKDRTPFKLKVDGLYVDVKDLGAIFDGRPHDITIETVTQCTPTHFAIQYGVADLLVDVSKRTIPVNNNVRLSQSDVTLVLPAVTNKELNGAIVYDSTDDLYYRVTSLNSSNTQGGWVQNLDLDARIVQPYELAYLLPKLNLKKIKRFGGSFSGHSTYPTGRYF